MSGGRIIGALAAGAALLVWAGACNALWGVDDLEFGSTARGGAEAGGASSATAAGGAGGAAGAAGTAGAGACQPAACADCMATDCVPETCADESQACAESSSCVAMVSCMGQCQPGAAVCQSECVASYPDAVQTFYALLECSSCQRDACAELCGAMCDGGCSNESADCNSCVNSLCVTAVCESPLAVCSQSTDCQDFATCIQDCAENDTECRSTCVQSHPDGADLYNEVIQCTVCTKPACWDICSAESPGCQGFTAS